eukprot:TRINITY_DN7933_c3_g1_i1.p1 TRINITY_DN7933_c3_g1~~TRINITY_DN7933_c3_g1_i1.p1  ORF type:complete len:506 (+),score=75.89 TRINITY_DN7933_c3_g1_i1:137-1654(+)
MSTQMLVYLSTQVRSQISPQHQEERVKASRCPFSGATLADSTDTLDSIHPMQMQRTMTEESGSDDTFEPFLLERCRTWPDIEGRKEPLDMKRSVSWPVVQGINAENRDNFIQQISSRLLGEFTCNSEFVIDSADALICNLLGYKRKELIGLSVLQLMPPAAAEIHEQLLAELQDASIEERRQKANSLLNDMSRCRDFVVLDSRRNPVACRIAVFLKDDLSSRVELRSRIGKVLHCVPRGFAQHINAAPGLHVREYEDVICIMMDIANSTSFAVNHSPAKMAELFHEVHEVVNREVQTEVFPYAYIHEIIGDSVLLVVNGGFMPCCPDRAATISFHIARCVQRKLDIMLSRYCPSMYARVGMAVGELAAGVVDGRMFRLFGRTVHMAQRLEATCPRGAITCCRSFFSDLQKTMKANAKLWFYPRFELNTSLLKGFGEVDHVIIWNTKTVVAEPLFHCVSTYFQRVQARQNSFIERPCEVSPLAASPAEEAGLQVSALDRSSHQLSS